MKWERAKESDTPKKRKGRGCLIAIVVVIAIAIVGNISRCIGGGSEKLEWPTSGLATMLPMPNSDKGRVVIDDAETFDATIEEWEKSDYDEYVNQCKDKGFTAEAIDDGDAYEAFSDDGHHLELSFYDGLEQMSIRLEAPVEMGAIAWPSGGAAALLPEPSSTTGQIEVDSSSQFSAYIGEMDPDAYDAYIDACMEAGFSVDYDRGDDYFNAEDSSGNSLHLEYRGLNTMHISLHAADLTEDADEEDEGAPEETPEEPEEPKAPEEPETPEESEAPAESDSTDYRAMLDEYEDFMNKYCDFMEKYSNGSGDTLSMAADYAEMMSQYSDWAEKMDAVDESELSDEDTQYYIEVQTRINQRLLEIGQD